MPSRTILLSASNPVTVRVIGYTIDDIRSQLKNYLLSSDTYDFVNDQKINSLDFTALIKQL